MTDTDNGQFAKKKSKGGLLGMGKAKTQEPVSFNIGNINNISLTIENEKDLIKDMIRLTLQYIVEDALRIYQIDEAYSWINRENVYAKEEAIFTQARASLRNILVESYMATEKNCLEVVHLRYGGIDFLMKMATQPNQRQVFLNTTTGNEYADIIKSLFVDPIGCQGLYKQLEIIMSSILYIYFSMQRDNELASKGIFKKFGLNQLMQSLPPEDFDETIAKIKSQAASILAKKGGVIDSQDDFSFVTMGAKNYAASIDFSMKELARVLQIPQTKLFGASPDGFNSTGESDAENYEQRLDVIRNGWIDPFLNKMGVPFQRINKVNLTKLNEIIMLYRNTGRQIPEYVLEKIDAAAMVL